MAADTAAPSSPSPSMPAASASAPMTAGLYNKGSAFQRGMNEAARDELLAAAAAVVALPPPHPTAPLAFADFGCSEGANAVAQMSAAVEAAKAALGGNGERRPITVSHVDLTANNWPTVFACAAAAPAYQDPPRSFVYAVGTPAGFYAQAFPAGSVALAHGAATFHWGSAGPSSLPDAVLFPWLSSDAAVREAAARRAAADWATILRHRAAELCAGGRFVAALVAAPPALAQAAAGGADPSTVLPSMWKHVAQVWAGLVDDGLLSREEAAGVVIPVNMSTPDDLKAPLVEEEAAAAEAAAEGPASIASLFSVVRWEVLDMVFPQYLEYQQSGDAAKYAADLRLFLEAVLKGMQVAAVEKLRAGRADAAASAAAVIESFYARLEAALAADPQPASQTVVVMHLERK